MAKPLRVGLTLEQCWHKVPGGTAASALRLAAVLQQRPAIDVVGISARHRHPPDDGWVPDVPVVALPLPRMPLYEAWHHLRWPHVEDTTGPLDVVHATGMAVPPVRGRLLVTVHDLAFVHFPDQPTRRGLRFFRTALEMARRHADLIHCPSQATADDCIAHGFPADRIRVVPWGLDWDVAGEREVDAVRAHYRLDRPYILFTGTLEPRKNLRRLIEAFDRIPRQEMELVLVGPEGWGEGNADAKDSRVRSLGFVPPADLAPLYRGATVFCYPSLLEGFGLPVLEAMSQGTPVVTSAGTATAEVGGDAVVTADPDDVDALVEALSSLLADASEAARLGEAGSERAKQFSWTRVAAEFEALYGELAA